MKKKIAILGSTGSIGKSLLNIISKNKKNFNVKLLTGHKNYKLLLRQAKLFKVKYIIITDKKSYDIAKSETSNNKIKIFNNFKNLNKILDNKIDYTMSAIVGIEGLLPTLKIIKYTNKIAIANKESIICAWNLIKKELKRYDTEFVPVDSEHFSIWYALKNNNSFLDKVYITASGGSLLNIPKSKINKLDHKIFLKHPNWKMGKKITVDSTTLMNKVFEIIEAKKIFNLDYKQLNIVIHPQSYIHTIVKFYDGMVKIIAHDTTMMIPIFNSVFSNKKYFNNSKNLNINKLNFLSFKKVDKIKFPSVKILATLPKKNSLYETVLVSANDELVKLFLNKKIRFNEIISKLSKIINKNEFKKYKKILPRNVTDVIKTNELVRLKINSLII